MVDSTRRARGSRSRWSPAAAWRRPLSDHAGGDAVTIGLKQSVAASDALRTGTYAKTLVFTLSTTAP